MYQISTSYRYSLTQINFFICKVRYLKPMFNTRNIPRITSGTCKTWKCKNRISDCVSNAVSVNEHKV